MQLQIQLSEEMFGYLNIYGIDNIIMTVNKLRVFIN